MLIIDNNIYDPWFNLAAEEYLFRNYTGNIFMLYINSRSVIIGKHQNPAEEVNARCLRENNIPLVRRISGGGAVYHDEGNLNYTYIRNTSDGKKILDAIRVEKLEKCKYFKNFTRDLGKVTSW